MAIRSKLVGVSVSRTLEQGYQRRKWQRRAMVTCVEYRIQSIESSIARPDIDIEVVARGVLEYRN